MARFGMGHNACSVRFVFIVEGFESKREDWRIIADLERLCVSELTN
jgi:hypothetical protein